MKDLIDRKAVLKIINDELEYSDNIYATSVCITIRRAVNDLPSAQPERYTKEELRVFAHGISLSLLSKRSAQHWRYDKDTATKIEFLERLYDKVSANMRGGQNE